MTKKFILMAATAGVLAMSGGAYAQNTLAPGQQMQEKGSVKGTTGASGYAPGHATTGTSAGAKADVKAGGVKAKTGVDADVKVK